ncbi:MAG: tetratricopeptide repeat protein [Sterolibacterium sp.]
MSAILERLLTARCGREFAFDGLALLLLASGLAALYGPHLGAPLVFDDVSYLGSNYASMIGGEFTPFLRRYWSWCSFVFQRIFFSDDPTELRIVNVMLHFLVGVALYWFGKALLAQVSLGNKPGVGVVSGMRRTTLWLGVALLLFHPVAVYGVAYIVQRSILMATLFSLLMWWAHLRGLDSGKPGWFALAILFYYLALYSKEHSIMAPAVACLLTLLVDRVAARRSLLALTFIAYFVLAVSVLPAALYVIASQYEPLLTEDRHAYLASVLTQSALFFKYLSVWWFPLPADMSIDIREPLAEIDSVASWLWFSAFLAYAAAAFHLVLRKGRVGLLGFALLAPALLFMTEFSTVRIQESFVLYRSYLWLPPMLVALPLVVESASGAKRLLVLGLAVCGVLFILSSERLNTFASQFLLWDEAIRLAERKGYQSFRDRQYFSRGGTHLAARHFELALQDFERALQWNPAQTTALLGKGLALTQLGRPQLALESFDKALALKPDWVDVYMARGELYYKLGDRKAAEFNFGLACTQGASIACYAQQRIRAGTNATVTISIPTP